MGQRGIHKPSASVNTELSLLPFNLLYNFDSTQLLPYVSSGDGRTARAVFCTLHYVVRLLLDKLVLMKTLRSAMHAAPARCGHPF